LALALLAALAYAGVFTYIGGYLYLKNWKIEGEYGAGVLVPNAFELWARRLVVYVNATGVRVMEYIPGPMWGETSWEESPLIFLIAFTVRTAGGEVVKEWRKIGNVSYAAPGPEMEPAEVYEPIPGGAKVYLVGIGISYSGKLYYVHVTNATPGALENAGSRQVFWRKFCKPPELVEAEALPNGTVAVTFVNMAAYDAWHDTCLSPANVTVRVDLGGDLWIWLSPSYPTLILAAPVDPLFWFSPILWPQDIFAVVYRTTLDVLPGNIAICGEHPLRIALFLGNDTLMVPPLAYPRFLGVEAVGEVKGFVYYAKPIWDCRQPMRNLPPVGVAKPLWDLRGQTAEICTEVGCKTVPAGTVFQIPPGYLVNASEPPVETPLGYVAVGTVYVHKPYYNVTVYLPNGTLEFTVRWGSLFNFTPPPIYLPNGTAYVGAPPISFVVMRNAAVRPNYTRLYLVEVRTPFGVVEAWTPEGRAFRYPGEERVFPNGTRVVVWPVEAAAVEGPAVIRANYTAYYNVTVATPLGAFWRWAERGSTFRYPGEERVFPNGTRIVVEPAAVKVEAPAVLAPNYTVYYLVLVKTPNGTLDVWAERGSTFSYGPEYWYFGNGTRLAGVKPCELRVEGPAECAVAYERRQYYVRVKMLDRAWEGWADEGTAFGLNRTIGGVSYIARPVVVTGPGNYAVYYTAVFEGVARDALGVPNPLAVARLCNAAARAGWDGKFRVEAETEDPCRAEVEAPPVSPYTAAMAVAATATAVAAARRIKR